MLTLVLGWDALPRPWMVYYVKDADYILVLKTT